MRLIHYLLSIICICFASACSPSPSEQVDYQTDGLRNGDLLFRTGAGIESHTVTEVSSGEFSHVGIAYRGPRGWMVIHAVPGENAKGEPEYLKCEPIAEFYRSDRALAGGKARVKCSDSIANAAAQHALQFVNDKVTFDNDYNSEDTAQLYCTELVHLVYGRQSIDLAGANRHSIPYFHSKEDIIFPEDIWASPFIEKKERFQKRVE